MHVLLIVKMRQYIAVLSAIFFCKFIATVMYGTITGLFLTTTKKEW